MIGPPGQGKAASCGSTYGLRMTKRHTLYIAASYIAASVALLAGALNGPALAQQPAPSGAQQPQNRRHHDLILRMLSACNASWIPIDRRRP